MDKKVGFSRKKLFPGFDGVTCKICPQIASDGRRMIMIYQSLVLTGMDVTCGLYLTESTDGGEHFSEPITLNELKDYYDGDIRYSYAVCPCYNEFHGRWFGYGAVNAFKDGKIYYGEDGQPVRKLIFCDYDAEARRFGKPVTLPFPEVYSAATQMNQCIELENGDIIIPFYCKEKGGDRYGCITARYSFADTGLSLVAIGEFLTDDGFDYSPYGFAKSVLGGTRGRGIYEPSVVKGKNKYYMTIRNDLVGLFATGDDGLSYRNIKPWVWDDGSVLENYNTQQHWVKIGDALYLAYNRITPHNSHVFRNRAPLFMARFDEERECLLRNTEIILAPELGARLGNFSALSVGSDTAFVAVAEWMQGPKGASGCASYGSDNSIWLTKVYLEDK